MEILSPPPGRGIVSKTLFEQPKSGSRSISRPGLEIWYVSRDFELRASLGFRDLVGFRSCAFRLNPMGFEGFGIWSHGIRWDLTKGFWDLKLHAFRGISWDLGCGITGFENCDLGISES